MTTGGERLSNMYVKSSGWSTASIIQFTVSRCNEVQLVNNDQQNINERYTQQQTYRNLNSQQQLMTKCSMNTSRWPHSHSHFSKQANAHLKKYTHKTNLCPLPLQNAESKIKTRLGLGHLFQSFSCPWYSFCSWSDIRQMSDQLLQKK